MRKLSWIFFASLLFLLIACEEATTESTTSGWSTISQTESETTQSTTSETVSVTEYDGPLYLGVTVSKELPSPSTPNRRKPNSVMHDSSDPRPLVIDSSLEAHRTTRNSQEYLVVHLQQPENILDTYAIFSITIRYPDGTQRVWQAGVHEINNDPESREWYISNDISEIYLPITASSEVSESTYTILAITYLDGTDIKDVEYAEGAETLVTLFVGNNPVTSVFPERDDPNRFTANLNLYKGKYYLNFSMISNVDNLPFHSVTLYGVDDDGFLCEKVITYEDIYVGGYNEIFTNPLAHYFSSGVLRSIEVPNDVLSNLHISESLWIKYTIEYEDGYGTFSRFTSYAFRQDFQAPSVLTITTGWELAIVEKDYKGVIYIMNDIIIPSYFTPFTSVDLHIEGGKNDGQISSVEEVPVITFEDPNCVFLDVQYDNSSINMQFLFFSTLRITNSSSTEVSLNEWVLYPLEHCFAVSYFPESLVIVTTRLQYNGSGYTYVK